MIIGREDIQFSSGDEFYDFVYRNDLYGIIQLKEPILDTAGVMLVKERVSLNENIIRKISNMEGRYISILKALITPQLVDKLAVRIAKEAQDIVSQKNTFINHLYGKSPNGGGNYKAIIEKSFYTPKITLYLFKLFSEKRAFFNYIMGNGLLSLGTMLQTDSNLKNLQRYTFLAGMLSDLCLVDTTYWNEGDSNGEQIAKICKISSNLLEKLGMSIIVRTALSEVDLDSLHIESEYPLLIEPGSIDPNKGYLKDLDLFRNFEEMETEKINEKEYRNLIDSITDAIKISKFIQVLSKRFAGYDNANELLILSFAYNTEKGYFSKQIGDIMIDSFKQYDGVIKKVRKIAEIENMCLFKDSAWAYPRTEPAQILCKNKEYKCKYVETGWDICIVSEKEAMGYVGMKLLPGIYPKCALESKLDVLYDNRVKPKADRK
jgi:hypothetical protein